MALAKAALAANDLRSRRLVQTFSPPVAVDFAYYIVAPKAKLNLPKVSHFIAWLREQAEADRQQHLAVA